jgi:hypothetical protein
MNKPLKRLLGKTGASAPRSPGGQRDAGRRRPAGRLLADMMGDILSLGAKTTSVRSAVP